MARSDIPALEFGPTPPKPIEVRTRIEQTVNIRFSSTEENGAFYFGSADTRGHVDHGFMIKGDQMIEIQEFDIYGGFGYTIKNHMFSCWPTIDKRLLSPIQPNEFWRLYRKALSDVANLEGER